MSINLVVGLFSRCLLFAASLVVLSGCSHVVDNFWHVPHSSSSNSQNVSHADYAQGNYEQENYERADYSQANQNYSEENYGETYDAGSELSESNTNNYPNVNDTQQVENSQQTRELSRTGVGALTGAALGGGLGLLIGSTTGNAAEGLALGTIAGTAAGAGIGRQLQLENDALEEQRELVVKQNEIINEQGRELEELKQGIGDRFDIPEFNQPSRMPDVGYQGSPQAKVWPAGESPITVDLSGNQNNTQTTEYSRGRIASASDSVPVTSVPLSGPVSRAEDISPPQATLPGTNTPEATLPALGTTAVESGPAKTARRATSSELPKANTLPRANTEMISETMAEDVVGDVVEEEEKIEEKAVETVKEVEEEKTRVMAAVTEETSKEPLKPAKAAMNIDRPVCTEAESEATRARGSASDADKLFYFRRAIRLCPEQADYYVELGKVYLNIGRTEEAQSEFSKALELDPENEAAQEELSMIMLGATY